MQSNTLLFLTVQKSHGEEEEEDKHKFPQVQTHMNGYRITCKQTQIK